MGAAGGRGPSENNVKTKVCRPYGITLSHVQRNRSRSPALDGIPPHNTVFELIYSGDAAPAQETLLRRE